MTGSEYIEQLCNLLNLLEKYLYNKKFSLVTNPARKYCSKYHLPESLITKLCIRHATFWTTIRRCLMIWQTMLSNISHKKNRFYQGRNGGASFICTTVRHDFIIAGAGIQTGEPFVCHLWCNPVYHPLRTLTRAKNSASVKFSDSARWWE